ncbi:cobalamin B12-binding domain-containing protein [Alkalibacter saccharofermentans]|uniref:Methanogenic corrinoid protein MtbC1 n=1 Tax=Alkalibacter saccharofermentans DSM 14828 TaxID=1120975 RepID=A0A1M4TF58_9FIRM|nr:cobalamin B12-binding domain-containing protein [Alkalibacter saccharofermentans]SHE43120.1 Methanogenic corrinoid protein MtbC1 [Alkalibacter saccharofermentans DSM 14828]
MEALYEKFKSLLETENKREAVRFSISLIENKDIGIVEYYEQILAKAMKDIKCHNDEKNLCIWREHVRSGIARTIIESLYSYVLEERRANYTEEPQKKVAVLCPDGEYHDMGARIAADYFTLLNWDAVFVGNSTPDYEFIKIADHLSLDAVAISVTNPYNLFSARKTVDLIRKELSGKIKIFAGGNAFAKDIKNERQMDVDGYVFNFEDLKKLLNGGEAK